MKTEAEGTLKDVQRKSNLESKENKLSNKLPQKKQEIQTKKEELSRKREKRDEIDEEKIKNRIKDLKQEITDKEKDRDQIKALLEKRAKELDVKPDKQIVNSKKSSLKTEIDKDEEKINSRDQINQKIKDKQQKIKTLNNQINQTENKIRELEQKIKKSGFYPSINQESDLYEKRDDILGVLGDLRGRQDGLREELMIFEDLNLEGLKEGLEEKTMM